MDKATKSAADYRDYPKGDQQCADCWMFIPPDGCTSVTGSISPSGWCKFWEKAMRKRANAGFGHVFKGRYQQGRQFRKLDRAVIDAIAEKVVADGVREMSKPIVTLDRREYQDHNIEETSDMFVKSHSDDDEMPALRSKARVQHRILGAFLDCVDLLARSAADLAPDAPPPAVIENIVVFGAARQSAHWQLNP